MSDDNSESWFDAGVSLGTVLSFAVNGTNLFAGGGDGLFVSTDNGENWTAAGSGLEGTVRSLAVSGPNLFAGTDKWPGDGGVFLSTNNGTSWTAVNTGLARTAVNSLAVKDSYLFAGTDSGIWRRPLSEMIITSVEEPSADRRLPGNFSLEQNYPNPFNPTTAISYQLSAVNYVTLKVYNSAGREVACLVDRQMPAGSHRTEWNASGVPSGIYFYRIQAGNYSETKKLVVMR